MRWMAVGLAVSVAGCSPPTSTAPSPGGAVARPAPALSGDFAFGLYRELGRTEDNLFLSPVSIRAAFGLAQAGARGETAAQIERVIGLGNPADAGALLRRLPIDEPGRRVTIANAVWVQTGYPLRPEYLRTVEASYGPVVRRVDFRRPLDAIGEINRWVEANTAGRIRRLIDPNGFDPDTRLVLTNTVYFKADWLQPFRASGTAPDRFHAPGGRVLTTPFMRQRARFRLLDEDGFRAIELPYKGEELSMLLFLPDARDGLPAFEQGLDAARLEGWIDALSRAEATFVDLALPKLKLEARYDLEGPLSALGMPLAFSQRADFSGITDAEALTIGRAVHQTFLLVDETGTEAAAATGLEMVPVSAPPPATPFRADHPFLLVIRDKRTGTDLFIGRVQEPRP